MDSQAENKPQAAEANGNKLEWRFNPWTDSIGMGWRRPQTAMLISIAIAIMFGISLSYPNYEIPPDAPAELAAEMQNQRENWGLQAIAWGGISFLLLIGMTATIYLPLGYRMDETGVMVRFLGTPSYRKWSHYRNYYIHSTGVHLTTMPEPSWLDPFRGHFLRYSGNKAEVDAFIEERMEEYKGKPPA